MFKDAYTRQRGLPSEAYHDALLMECLYWHARLVARVVPDFKSNQLAADADLIDSVASLRRRSQLNDCLFEHHHHPHNRGIMRKILRLRISIKKLHRIFYSIVPPNSGSTPPVT